MSREREIKLSFQVRPFYEKRMGQEVEADTLGDEFKVTLTMQSRLLSSVGQNGPFVIAIILICYRATFSASLEATTSRASP